MIKLLIVWNAAVTIVLTAVLFTLFSHRSKVEHVSPTDVVRTSRLEIVDPNGKTKAVLGTEDGRSSSPKLILYNQRSRGRHPDCEFKWLRNNVFPGQADGWKGFCWLSVGQRYSKLGERLKTHSPAGEFVSEDRIFVKPASDCLIMENQYRSLSRVARPK